MPRVDKVLLERARALRREMSPVEAHLWYALRDRRLNGYKFNRNAVVCGYIADFIARTSKLIIELDGDSHGGRETYDDRRTFVLEQNGYRVLRFSNSDVMTNTEGVLLAVIEALSHCPSPRPSPRRGEGEEGFPT